MRSHIRVPGNELADWLADLGRGGGGVTLAEAERWMADWLRRGEAERSGQGPAALTEGPRIDSAGPPQYPLHVM